MATFCFVSRSSLVCFWMVTTRRLNSDPRPPSLGGLALLVVFHIRVQLPFHTCPNKPSLAGEKTPFGFETITPNVPGVKIPLGDEWWMFHSENTLCSYHSGYLCMMMFFGENPKYGTWWAVVVVIKKCRKSKPNHFKLQWQPTSSVRYLKQTPGEIFVLKLSVWSAIKLHKSENYTVVRRVV